MAFDWNVLIGALAGVSGSAVTGWLLNRREDQRVRLQHTEDHFRHRQGVYHKAIQCVALVVSRGEHQVSDPAWRATWIEHASGVHLFGSQKAVDAFSVLEDEVAQVMLWCDEGLQTDPEDSPSLVAVYQALEEFTAVARSETAPDGTNHVREGG